MKLTLWNIHYIAKRLSMAAQEASEASIVAEKVDPPLTQGEASVLEYLLAQSDYRSIREIVHSTGIVQSWVSTVVKSLVKRGWVETGTDPRDRRVTTVKVTEEIRKETREVLRQDAEYALGPMLENASETEVEVIEAGLVKLLEVFKRKEVSSFKSDALS